MIHADESDLFRYKRDIGGESLDTSNFVLYVDPNGSRFIEVPKEYMNNWLDDQKMWRRWSIILAILCILLFGTLLFFLIYGFCTSTGPFTNCTKYFNDNSSDDKLFTSAVTLPMEYTPKTNIIPIPKKTFLAGSYHVSPLPSTGQSPSK